MAQARDSKGRFVSNVISTKFTSEGAAAMAQKMSMLSRVMGPAGAAISGVTSLLSPLNAALGALAGGAALAGVTRISSQFEDMQFAMAQTMRFMQQADPWPEAMKVAKQGSRETLEIVFVRIQLTFFERDDSGNLIGTQVICWETVNNTPSCSL